MAWGVTLDGDESGADDDAAGVALAGKIAINKNSLKSRAKNHGYTIEKFNGRTGNWETQKYGITAQGLNKKGETLRARYQISKWQRSDGALFRTSTMGQFNTRRQAAEWERQVTRDYYGTRGSNPPRQVRPNGAPR